MLDGTPKKGFIISGAYPSGSLAAGSVGPTIYNYTTAWPYIVVFNVTDTTNYWQVPYDPSFDVFQSFSDPFNPLSVGFDGGFWGQFSPDMSQLAIIRIAQNVGGNRLLTNSTFPPFSDVTWTVLSGLGFNNSTKQVTWKSVSNGHVVVPYSGRLAITADAPLPTITSFETINDQTTVPMMWWDTDNAFHFDLWGFFFSFIETFDIPDNLTTARQFEGIVYGTDIQSGGSMSFSIDNCWQSDGVFPTYNRSVNTFFGTFESSRGHGLFAQTLSAPFTIAGFTPLFSNRHGVRSNTMSFSPPSGFSGPFFCSPYTVIQTTISFNDPTVFDSTRTYPPDPAWQINSSPGNSSIKVNDDAQFTRIDQSFGTFVGGTAPLTINLTNYSWDTHLNATVKGTKILGKPLTFNNVPTALNQVGTILDWAIK